MALCATQARIKAAGAFHQGCTCTTVDFFIPSPLMTRPYEPATKDYTAYLGNKVEEVETI